MRRPSGKSAVKFRGSTPRLPLILSDWSVVGAGGMRQVAVKCIDMPQNTNSEGIPRGDTDAEARKRGYRTGLDTLVVHAVNDDDWVFGAKLQGPERKR